MIIKCRDYVNNTVVIETTTQVSREVEKQDRETEPIENNNDDEPENNRLNLTFLSCSFSYE